MGKRTRNFLHGLKYFSSQVLVRDYFSLLRKMKFKPSGKTRRVVVKGHSDPRELARERQARARIADIHFGITPRHYSLKFSKRYPRIRGKRVEEYYDRPSLRDVLDKRLNRRLRELLERDQVQFAELHESAIKAFEEFMDRSSPAEADLGPDQLLVDRCNKKDGKIDLILVDA